MIKSAYNKPISELFDIDGKFVYTIPRYQREYTWGVTQWQPLFDDLVENDAGYFLGSIICINQSDDSMAVQELEVVDGQQRLTTLSLLFAAVYQSLMQLDGELDDDQRAERNNLKRKLVLKGSDDRLRLVPQIQNRNQDDFRWVLSEVNAIRPYEYPSNAGNRRVVKAFRYFLKRVKKMLEADVDPRIKLLNFVDKVSQASMVKIEVASHTDAYVLFESLNDRGIPLTAVDLLKNKLLARIERDDPGKVDYYFEQWRGLLEVLGGDYPIHERFFRHYYNAFRDELQSIYKVPMATKSNLIRIFEKLIDYDAKECLNNAAAAARVYAVILARRTDESLRELVKPLQNLERIQGAPLYVLLLNFLARRKHLELTNAHLIDIIETLIRFFVRRNLTDSPPTNAVTRLPLDILNEIGELRGAEIVKFVADRLAAISASNEEFRKKLEGPIYEDNDNVARFILVSLAEKAMTNETFTDLWSKKDNQWIWTIEHILPQGENIPKAWVDMIAGGDAAIAKDIQQKFVHKLGNLTITGNNSSLGNKSFEEKRDHKDSEGRNVGYKNGLGLNQDLATLNSWSVEQIEQRGNKLVDAALDLFVLEGITD